MRCFDGVLCDLRAVLATGVGTFTEYPRLFSYSDPVSRIVTNSIFSISRRCRMSGPSVAEGNSFEQLARSPAFPPI